MLRLEDREWRAFNLVGIGGLFTVRSSSHRIDASKLTDGDNKMIPYVTRSDANNGVKCFVSTVNAERGLEAGCCISIGLDTGTVFWHEYPFITGQSIQILTGQNLNRYTALFLRPLLQKQLAQLNWGHGASLKRLQRMKIMLPITNDGKPDFQFMEDYVREMIGSKI